MASAAALNSPKVGSFIPDCDWGKYAIEYARLGPRKVLPGAQQSFVNLIIAETTGINTTRRTKPRGIAAWADECNCEERQMASIMNDALERGLVYSFPELARGTDGKIDVAKKPKKLEFYMPAPAAWREIADLPKRPKLLKMPDPELTEEEAGDDETRNTLRDSVKLPRLSLPRKRTVKQDLPLATNELSYRNDSGLDLDVLAVVRPSGACVLRIALPAETRNTLRDSDPAARTDNHSEKSNGLQHRPADETRNGLRVSGSAARNDGAHRDELRLALNAKLRDPARFPDDALWKRVVTALSDTADEAFLQIVERRIADGYDVRPPLLVTLARQAAAAAKNPPAVSNDTEPARPSLPDPNEIRERWNEQRRKKSHA